MDNFIKLVQIVVFGIVEGITEWLPISSTGHLIILEEIFDAEKIFVGGKPFWDFFLVAIQLGAILAVIICFFNKLNPLGGKSLVDPTQKKSAAEKKNIWLLWAKVLVACLPACVVGLVADDWLDSMFYNGITVAVTLIVYGVLFIVLEIWNKKKTFKTNDVNDLSFKTAFLIGLFQLLALIPGTSRSGITILGAMLLLCNREVACEFSFFLSIPIMLGASVLKGAKFLLEGNELVASDLMLLGIGALVAFAVSFVAIKFLLGFVRKHDFKVFGYYRIALGVLLIILLLANVIK